MAWMNNDGLNIKYGTAAGAATTGGGRVYPAEGGLTVVEFKLDLTTLASSGTILFDNVFIPARAWFEKIEVVCQVAADSAGDGAKFNLGLQKLDRSTEGDYDGLLDSYAQASMDAINETGTATVVTSGAGGALMGAPAAYAGYLAGYYETEAFTQGTVIVRVYYRMNSNVKGSDWTTVS